MNVSSGDKNRVCSREARFQHEHRIMNFDHPMRERENWVSKPVNGASERGERSEAERFRASERSEQNELSEQSERSERSELCKQIDVASDRVALSKRDYYE